MAEGTIKRLTDRGFGFIDSVLPASVQKAISRRRWLGVGVLWAAAASDYDGDALRCCRSDVSSRSRMNPARSFLSVAEYHASASPVGRLRLPTATGPCRASDSGCAALRRRLRDRSCLIIPGHPVLGVRGKLVGMSLKLTQIVERIRPT